MSRRRARISLHGKVVAVTGAARGIGLATAHALARAGASVALGDRDGEMAEQAAERIPNALGSFVDVADVEAFGRFLDRVEEGLGPLYAIVNNAGIMAVGPLEAEDDETTARQIEVNLGGVVNGVKAAIPRLRANGSGHIVNVASVLGKTAQPWAATYSATKHAIVGLSEAVRGELRGAGIHVTVVLPHTTSTDLAAGFGDPPRLLRPVAPEQVADAIAAVLERPRFEVYVPSYQRPASALLPVLTPAARDAVYRFLGSDRVLGEVDRGKRARQYARAGR